MKKLLILTLSLLISGVTIAQNAKKTIDKGVKFEQGTFAEAINKAKSKKTPNLIFLDCYTTWCGPCKTMTEKVFPQEMMGNFFNKNFVNIKIDMEKGEGVELAKKFGIRAYPTFLIIDSEGNELNRVVGGTGPGGEQGFIDRVKKAMDPANSPKALKAAFEANKNLETGKAYMTALTEASIDASEIASEMYWLAMSSNKMDNELFNTICGSIKKLNSPVLADMCLKQNIISNKIGSKMFAEGLKNIYAENFFYILRGRNTKFDVAEIEAAAKQFGLLNLSTSDVTSHFGPIVVLYINNNVKDMITYYKENVYNIADSYLKGQLEGVLANMTLKCSDAEKTAILEYFNAASTKAQRTADNYKKVGENIK